jgi:hypothetical protein
VTELQVWYGFFDFKFDRLAAIRLRVLMESQDNAREFQKIAKKDGSFSNFLESLKALEKAVEILKRFRLPGEPAARYYLHSVGHWK